MNKEKKSIKHLIFHCGNLLNNEKCLILYNSSTLNIAKKFYVNAKEVSNYVKLKKVEPFNFHGGTVNKTIEKLMINSDLIICLTKYSLAQSISRQRASEKGARFLSLPFYDNKVLKDKSLSINFKKKFKITNKISQLYSKGKQVTIRSSLGTNLVSKINFRKGNCCPGYVKKQGDLGSPPDVEANISPIENGSNGTIVVDGSVADPGIGILKEPLTLIIKKGKIIKFQIRNKKKLNYLNKMFGSKSSKKRVLAEIGIGLNHKAKLTGNMLIDEGCLGTVHFGFGSNSTVGGKNKINFHLDFMVKKTTLKIDKKTIVKNGKLAV